MAKSKGCRRAIYGATIPSGSLKFWKPRQAGMICHHGKMSSRQVIPEQFNRHHYSQQLFIGGAVTALHVAEGLRGIGYYSLNNLSSLLLVLFQHCSYPDITGIGAEGEVSFSGGVGQHGCRNQRCFKGLEGSFTRVIPH